MLFLSTKLLVSGKRYNAHVWKNRLRYTGLEEMRKTGEALKELSPEDRKVIDSADSRQLRRLIADKSAAPETFEAAVREYYQKHPEFIKPLERLEELVKAG
jgi:phosphohistidine phosphatase SixA